MIALTLKPGHAGEEEETGRLLYPTFATVTYLTGEGGPTVIADKRGRVTADSSHSEGGLQGVIHKVRSYMCMLQ